MPCKTRSTFSPGSYSGIARVNVVLHFLKDEFLCVKKSALLEDSIVSLPHVYNCGLVSHRMKPMDESMDDLIEDSRFDERNISPGTVGEGRVNGLLLILSNLKK
jgi:hypothetical protein